MKCKENNTLIFIVDLVYTCTYKDSIKSNSQRCILFDLPDQVFFWYLSIFFWHHLSAKSYNMIQMQQSSHILIKYSSELQLLVIHETKHTICRTIFKESETVWHSTLCCWCNKLFHG